MTWGIDFTADIFLPRQGYSGKQDVKNRMEELDELINGCEVRLKMYAASTPIDIISDEDVEDTIYWLDNRIDEELSLYREYLISRYNLELYLDHLEQKEQNGI